MRILAAAALVAVFVSSPALAQSTDADALLQRGLSAGGADRLQNLAHSPELKSCASAPCQTLRALLTTFAALNDRDFPNSQARGKREGASGGVRPRLNALARADLRAPERACHMLAVIAASAADRPTALHAIEMASLLSGARRPCLDGVLAALPDGPDRRALVADAHDLCVARGEPRCEAIAWDRR